MIVRADAYYRVTEYRNGIVMVCSVSTQKKAEEMERMMQKDQIVDLRHYRYIFHPDRIYIIKKPNITPKYYV